MACCPKIGKHGTIYSLNEDETKKFSLKLPKLVQKRIALITKSILNIFLEQTADYIFVNGKIFTMNDKEEQAEAVAIKDGDILFVGKTLDALPFRSQKTIVVDLMGKTMLPGFIDPHVHMCFTMFKHWIDLSPFVHNHMDQIKQKIIDSLKNAKQGQWICAQLFDPTIMQGELDVNIKGLDEICPDYPLFILESNAHVAHVNSAAFKAAGITKQTEDPPHGRIMRDQNGQLTGQLQQSAVMMLSKYLFTSGEHYEKNFQQFLHHCASKGCTSLHDCGIGSIDPKTDLSILYQVFERPQPVRYSGMLVSTAWDTWMEEKLVPQYKDQTIRINGIKCWSDGSAQGGSAFMRQPYMKQQWKVGQANYDFETLKKSVKSAHDQDWQVGVHANGDAAIDLVLDVIQSVQKQNPKPNLRHRIQHCTVCHKDQLKRMKQLNVSPSFLIGHVYFYGHVFQKLILGEQRSNLLDPMNTALQCGLKISMHSDYNCQPVDPIRCLANAVNRKMRRDNLALNEKQCITPYQALKALTIDSAWQCHLDDIVGSIQKGKKADFVILDRDPTIIPQSQLINLKVQQTWMNGRRTYYTKQLKTLKSLDSISSYKSMKSAGSFESKQSV